MRKAEQIRENETVENYYNVYLGKLNSQLIQVFDKLYTCNAKVYYVNGGAVLVSYNTRVAAFDIATNTVYDNSRKVYGYTPTTAQHIAKFAKFCNANKVLHYRNV